MELFGELGIIQKQKRILFPQNSGKSTIPLQRQIRLEEYAVHLALIEECFQQLFQLNAACVPVFQCDSIIRRQEK